MENEAARDGKQEFAERDILKEAEAMDITKMILEQLDKLRAEYEIHASNINESWPGMGKVPTDRQLIYYALTTELENMQKLNGRHRGRRRGKVGPDTTTITDFSSMIAEEEGRLGVNDEEFRKRHQEIMEALDEIEKRATDQSRRAHK